RSRSIEFKNRKVLSPFQIFNRSSFDVVASVEEFFVIMTQLIKNSGEILIDLVMQIGEMSSTVVITCIGQIKYLIFRNDPVKPVAVAMLHFFKPEFGAGMFLYELF